MSTVHGASNGEQRGGGIDGETKEVDRGLRSAAATHVGRVRPLNEDSYLALPGLVLVADGMGGHACGDVASALTIHAFAALRGHEYLEPQDVASAIDQANQAILDEASAYPEKAGMGTTVAGVAVVNQAGSPHWLVFNVGDSRVYRIADGVLTQLTVDHSEVAELVASGQVSRGAARTHPLRNVITRSLGSEPTPTLDTWLVPVTRDDLFLVCSDGLTTELDDQEIARVITTAQSISVAASALVEAAVSAGGRDNVTVILASADDGQGPFDDGADALTVPRADNAGSQGHERP